MKLDEALSHADDKLRAFTRQDRAKVVEEIRVMHNQQSAAGFKSGATLRMTTRIAIAAIERRITELMVTLKECVKEVSPSLRDAKHLQPTIEKFLPEDLDDLGVHLKHIVELIAEPNTMAPVVNPVIEYRANELQRVQVDLHLYLLSIYRAPKSFLTPLNIVTVASGLASVVLCIRWVMDPSGPYEPWLALLSAVTAVILVLVPRLKTFASR